MTMKRTATALFRNNRIVIPKEIRKGVSKNCKAALACVDGVTLVVEPDAASDATYSVDLSSGQIKVPPAVSSTLGWMNGAVLSLDHTEETNSLRVSKIDPEHHPDYQSPLRDQWNLPIPPHFLAEAFSGQPDPVGAIQKGRAIAQFVIEKAQRAGVTLDSGSRFLDFGCGTGRTLRHLPSMTGAEVIGTDLHQLTMKWCRQQYPFGTFIDGQLEPPLPLDAGSIDVMLAMSVLTHLNAKQCEAWLWEWKRLLRPGGVAVVTFHGDGYVNKRSGDNPERMDEIRRMTARDGIYFSQDYGWKGIFPEDYQTTYHSDDCVRKTWGAIMELIEIVPSGGFINAQDVAVLRNS